MPYTHVHHYYGNISLFHNDMYICDHIKNNLIWESHIIDKFNQYYNEGNILDIGAHIGLHTIALSKICQNKVYSFEANKHIFNLLQYNTKNIENVVLYNNAVSKDNTSMKYTPDVNFDSVDIINTGGHACVNGNCPGSMPICTLDIDSLQLKDISLVKIDVEGMELDVLEGMRTCLETDKPVLIIEIHIKDFQRTVEHIKREYNYVVVEKIDEIDYVMKHITTLN